MVCILRHLPTPGQFSPVGSQKHQLWKHWFMCSRFKESMVGTAGPLPHFLEHMSHTYFKHPCWNRCYWIMYCVSRDPNVRVCNLLFLYHHLLLNKKWLWMTTVTSTSCPSHVHPPTIRWLPVSFKSDVQPQQWHQRLVEELTSPAHLHM